MAIACPRHGVVDVVKDAPCPACGVAAYDLDDRGARDVVRQNRESAHKTRKLIAGAVLFVGGFALASALPIYFVVFGVNLIALTTATVAAIFLARPLALRIETDAKLRALDAELTRNKI